MSVLSPTRRLIVALALAADLILGVSSLRAAGGPPPVPLDKEELAFLVGQSGLHQGRLDQLRVSAGVERQFVLQTTINPKLQEMMTARARQAGAPMVALAALDPRTGQVKALVSHDRLPGQVNYALTPAFPAASIFKMVTAAAALEKGGLTPASTIPFHGGSHTLYVGQLKLYEPNAPRRPTLAESFAHSFNPVFGKLANRPVGPALLEHFALRFGFNQAIRFELPVTPSFVNVPRDSAFELAQVGSGFNRDTTLSPLHGALMAATVVNGGVMMEPFIVDRVTVHQSRQPGAEVYHGSPQVMRRALSAETAAAMRSLMTATMTVGTGRSVFGRARRDRVLKNLQLGGKTGSINDSSQRYRIDWFVGYGVESRTGEALAVGVVVAHDMSHRGVNSKQLAREALRAYFDPRPPVVSAGGRVSDEDRPAVRQGQPRPKTQPARPAVAGKTKGTKSPAKPEPKVKTTAKSKEG